MDTNKRYNQEKALSERLESHEVPIGKLEMNSFEELLDSNVVSKGLFKIPSWITYLGLTSIVICGFYFLGNYTDSTLKQDAVTQQIQNLNGQNLINVDSETFGDIDVLDFSVNETIDVEIAQSNIKNEGFESIANRTESIEEKINKKSNSSKIKSKQITVEVESNTGEYDSQSSSQEIEASESTSFSVNSISNTNFNNNANFNTSSDPNSNSKFQENKRTSIELLKHLKATSQSIDSNDDLVRQANIVGIDLLKFLKLKLDYNYSLDVPDKLVSNIDVEKPLVKRTSFGLVYSRGKVLANDFTPHPLDPFFVRVEDGNSFGIGFVGQYNLSKRNFLRFRFVYNKFSQLQFVDGLLFSSLIATSAHLEAIDHELGFGLDYGFSFISDFKGFSVSAGAGASYRHKITTESNNFYTNGETEPIDNTTTSSISPFAYNVYFLFEKQLGNMIVGIEPSYTFHSRVVDHKASLIMGAEADYDNRYTLTFSFRIK